MATRHQKRVQLEKPDETLLEEHEDAADVILENGTAYNSVKQRRNLQKDYDDLSTVEKWEYAIDVVEMREGENYDSAEELIKDIYDKELDLDTYSSWTDDYQDESFRVDSPDVNRLSGDPMQVEVQAEVKSEENDEAWIEFTQIDFANRWEEWL